jgi:hypothetical protein
MLAVMPSTDHPRRVATYADLSTALTLLSDRELAELVAAAPIASVGIGGTAGVVEIGGARVFAKRVFLTGPERDQVLSTANLFGLPTFCQYGVGSPSFGAWRELAAHVMTTNWVVSGQCEGFPLLFHWRMLDGLPPGLPRSTELDDVDAVVEYWHGSAAVRERVDALARASASVLLFLEYVPRNLADWLAEQAAAGDDAVEAAAAMVERDLLAVVPAMNARGLRHFDAHFRNILTDGNRLYLSDFGLATSARFELSADEAEFAALHERHDEAYALTQLVNWLNRTYTDRPLPAFAQAVVARHARVAAVVNDFYYQLFGTSRATEYPAEAVAAALS